MGLFPNLTYGDEKMGNEKMSWNLLLAFILLFIVFHAMNASVVLAYSGNFYVFGGNNNGYRFYRGVRGYQLTSNVDIYDQSGCASFVVLQQDSGDFMAVGFYEGHDPNGGFVSTPHYYVDRSLHGVYKFWKFEQAPVGQSHRYWVVLVQVPGSPACMKAIIDVTTKVNENGYDALDSYASGQSESHDTRNEMDYHFWQMQAKPFEPRWSSFHHTWFGADNPYRYNRISDSEWYALGQG